MYANNKKDGKNRPKTVQIVIMQAYTIRSEQEK